jgi:protein-S-isoprenylcysteine O-methyltransferase Ste14
MLPNDWIALTRNPLGIFQLAVALLLCLCAFAIIISIVINFIESRSRGKARTEKKSIVATGTMTLFFLCFYLLIRFGIGAVKMTHVPFHIVCALIGLAMVICGCIVNIRGRLDLGANWANHIKIYEGHELIERGIFRRVRHPLYASLMLIFYGASLIYLNVAAFLANTFIFIPFMYYRARQEEVLLERQFPGYRQYREKTGMFVPKWGVGCSTGTGPSD